MKKDFLSALTPASIAKDPFPLAAVMDGSLFYPASDTDGSPIRHWPLDILSFVYVDMSVDSARFDAETMNHPPQGYRLLGMRELGSHELVPNGWKTKIPDSVKIGDYLRSVEMAGATKANSFGRWSVFEREANRDESHGPARFSLVFARAEGLAACQALYSSNGFRPAAVAILRPGTGYGGNFDTFEPALIEILGANPLGMPPWLMQWHRTSHGQQPEGPWVAHYGQRSHGPFSKDREEGFFQFSIYPASGAPVRAGDPNATDN
jgi:hypothetical protein